MPMIPDSERRVNRASDAIKPAVTQATTAATISATEIREILMRSGENPCSSFSCAMACRRSMRCCCVAAGTSSSDGTSTRSE